MQSTQTLAEELDLLKSIYSSSELTITSTQSNIQIIYISTIDTKLNIHICIKFNINSQITITVENWQKSSEKLSLKILQHIHENLTIHLQVYLTETESDAMPILDCISYCNTELIAENNVIINEIQQIKQLKQKQQKHKQIIINNE
eukprot:532259_1